MQPISSSKSISLPLWGLIPPGVYLFILPFGHTIAIRWLALGAGIVAAVRYYPKAAVPRLPCKLSITLWLIVSSASLIWAQNFDYSFGEFKIDVLYASAGFLVLFILTDSEEAFRIMLRAVLLGSFVISMMAVSSYLQNDVWVPHHQNFLGEFTSCMLMSVALIPLMAAEETQRNKKLLIVMPTLAIILAAGLCARSRIFWISVIAMVFVAGIMYSWNEPKKVRFAVAGGLLLVLGLGIGGYIFASGRPGIITESNDPRPAIWQQAFRNLSEKPFTGAGFGREVYKERYEALNPGKGLYHAHNIFLSYGEQMGLQGITSLVVLFIALLRRFVRFWKMDDPMIRNIGIAGTTLIVGVIIKSTTDTHFGREVTLYFWAIMGMLMGYGCRREDSSIEAGRRQR
jgi:O-antigen ligase